MIVVRNVFQAKYGRGDELVAILKGAQAIWPEMSFDRILTDASGPLFTVVTETEVESLAAREENIEQVMQNVEFGEWFGRTLPLVESGSRQFYNIVE